MSPSEQTVTELRDLVTRYPDSRSALMPMLHLVQSEDGMITGKAVETIAGILGLSTAEVQAVATFYTMYRRRSPGGEHHVGVCTNTMCGLLGGDALFEALSRRLGVESGGTTPDGRVTLERIECQAACTHAPVLTVDWEYFDRMTVEGAMAVIDHLEAGRDVQPTRGPTVRGWKAADRTIAAFDDGLADSGGGADDLMLAGLNRAKQLGQAAPGGPN